MSTRTEEPTIETPVLPVQAARAEESVLREVDHVRTHGRRCYWDVTECRWECRPD